METTALMKIAYSHKTPQSLRKSIARVCEKLPKSPNEKLAVTKTLAKNHGMELFIA